MRKQKSKVSRSSISRGRRLTYAERKKRSRTALICFFTITKAWGLTDEEKMRFIGVESKSVLEGYEKNSDQAGREVVLSEKQLEIVSYILKIYKALSVLFPRSRDEWMKKNNSAWPFLGQSAMGFIMSGDVSLLRIIYVTQYLEGQLQ